MIWGLFVFYRVFLFENKLFDHKLRNIRVVRRTLNYTQYAMFINDVLFWVNSESKGVCFIGIFSNLVHSY